MLDEILNSILARGDLKAREIADLAGVSRAAAYRWINGECLPSFETVVRLVERLPVEAQADFLIWVAPEPWEAILFHDDESSLPDVEDPEAFLTAWLKTAECALESLGQARRSIDADGLDDLQHACKTLEELTRQCMTTRQRMMRAVE